jgi:hypothetical protein
MQSILMVQCGPLNGIMDNGINWINWHFQSVPSAREMGCSSEKAVQLIVLFAYWDQIWPGSE